jgi:hypothetical protein
MNNNAIYNKKQKKKGSLGQKGQTLLGQRL